MSDCASEQMFALGLACKQIVGEDLKIQFGLWRHIADEMGVDMNKWPKQDGKTAIKNTCICMTERNRNNIISYGLIYCNGHADGRDVIGKLLVQVSYKPLKFTMT